MSPQPAACPRLLTALIGRRHWNMGLAGARHGCLAIAGWLALASSPAMAATLTPQVTFGTSIYNHLSTTSPRTTFHSQTITPHLRLDASTPRWGLLLLGERRYEFYSGLSDQLPQASDATADRAAVRLQHARSEHESVVFDGLYTRLHDLLDADESTVVIDGDVTRWAG